MRGCRSVLVYVGHRARGEFAVERAARLAERSSASVTLVVDEEVGSASRGGLERLAQLVVDRGIDLHVKALRRRTVRALGAEIEAANAELVVKAADREDMAPPLLFASFTEKLARACSVPVWVVRLAPPHRPTSIVATLDGRDPRIDAEVLATAQRIAEPHASSLFTLSNDVLISTSGRAVRVPADSGQAADTIIAGIEAVGADLVVVALDPRGSLHGETLSRLLRSTHASVAVVPHRARERVRRPEAAWLRADAIA